MLATDVPSHARLATEVLRAGKHCFVEKPLAQSAAEAAAVVDEAAAADRVLMVGHLLEYHPGVAKLKEIVDSGELGDVRYVYSNRLNLGKIREDENALWSLGAHDVSVLLHLFDGRSRWRRSRTASRSCATASRTSCSATCAFPPAASRTCTSRGSTRTRSGASPSWASDRMATFDDMALERKVTIYDKGFDPPTSATTASTSPARAT